MSTETTTTAPALPGAVTRTLTRDDLRALRTARSVGFYFHQGRGYLRAYLDNTSPDRILTASEQRVFPRADEWLGRFRELDIPIGVTGYEPDDGGMWSNRTEPDAYAYALVYTYNDMWRTFARILRAGDALIIRFTADNNNGYLNKAGLHYDEMHAVIPRDGDPWTFQLAHAVTEDNSSRMVRRRLPAGH